MRRQPTVLLREYLGRTIPLLVRSISSFSFCSILANAAGCTQFAAGRAPNFVLLDFVDLGNGLDAVNQLNGL